jgi:hypothetical protein
LVEVSQSDESNGPAATDRFLWVYSSRSALVNSDNDGVIVLVVSPPAAM